MRGKADVVLNRIDRIGITPAYAGKRPQTAGATPARRDHPRLCGEKDAEIIASVIPAGSPPPMRGKVNQKQLSVDANGITPAYAGKSDSTFPFKMIQQGSPPPMRGKAVVAAVL